jgi:uncharacterized DUF497 family protein
LAKGFSVYERDEAEHEASLNKHGYDFADADRVYESPRKLTLSAESRSEFRFQDIAIVEMLGAILSLVYVRWEYKIRIISFPKA